MYDRTALRAAAAQCGDDNANQIARRLGIPRETAYRLWRGTASPSGPVAAAVQAAYGVPVADLLIPAGVAA